MSHWPLPVLRPAALALVGLLLAACPDDDEPRIAGNIFAALGAPLPSATPEQLAAFERGRAFALHRFTPETGLGPTFNVTFCGACHERPSTGGSSPRYRDFVLAGFRFDNGTVLKLGNDGVAPVLSVDDDSRHASPRGANLFANRNAIPFFGVGLLAEIPEAEILRFADPDDLDGDGVSGRPNWDRGFVGRFGRKAQTTSIEGFIRGPLKNHLGITSNPLPDALKAKLPVPSAADLADARLGGDEGTGTDGLSTRAGAQAAAPNAPTTDDDDVPDPELSEADLFDLVTFSMLLAAPAPDPPTPASERGRALFGRAGCDGCHRPALRGPRGLVPAYTDLLLHDMGPDLADGMPMGVAEGFEFRTQPLWGVVATGPYLHDGRADTLDEAIRWHGGEAERSREAYEALTAAQQGDVLAFLASLGGASQRTDGLIPPGTPVPDAGETGGPLRPLDAAEAAAFEAGRALFDRAVPLGEGLGPLFNGDTCSGCHADPTTGGAGGLGLNVVRHGLVDPASEAFAPPAQGTMAPKHTVDPAAAAPHDDLANIFEMRQTPSVFGLGLLSRVPEAAILAAEDPDDADGDGISGRAHRLADGRVGRLGWKGNVPTVEEFLRDAMLGELGVTVPARDGRTFGASADADGVPDPELGDAAYDAVLFYLEALAPPRPRSEDPAAEAAGADVFEALACDACHTPALPTDDGTPVPAYTDLLLHDVAEEGSWGIVDGAAGMREFRTPPLWGVVDTAPYLHDGRASTLEAAIEAHHGEAAASRDAWLALDPADRDDLVAFLRSL